MTRKRLLEIEELAFRVLQTAGFSEQPVNVTFIAEQHNIKVVSHAFPDDISGVLVEKNGVFTIGYNEKHSSNRTRFTIAHELGHFFLKHQRQGIFIDGNTIKQNLVMFRDSFSSMGENSQEREANAFAAALLMPRFFIEKYIQDNNIDLLEEFALSNMSLKFKVSDGAMAFRLSNLRIFL